MTAPPPGRLARLRRGLLLAVIALIAVVFALLSLAATCITGRR